MKKLSSSDEMEENLINAVKEMLVDVPELVNVSYSIYDWTYRKLSLTEMSESHLLFILNHRIDQLTKVIKNNDTKLKMFHISELILFLIAWCVMKYSDKWWSSYQRNNIV